MSVLAKLMSRLNYSWSDQICLPLMIGCTCVQKVDSIVQARQQVHANFNMKEDRMVAINVLATHWRNQRKTFVKKNKELALVETGKRMVERLFLAAYACPSLMQQLPFTMQQECCFCSFLEMALGILSIASCISPMYAFLSAGSKGDDGSDHETDEQSEDPLEDPERSDKNN